MTTRRRSHRLLSALAALVMLVAAWLPGWATAFAPRGEGGWTEVCTLQGMQRVPVSADGAAPAAPGADHVMDHCPCCPGGHGGMAPPSPPAGLTARPAPAGAHRPPAFLQAPVTAHAWVTAAPRAPPRPDLA